MSDSKKTDTNEQQDGDDVEIWGEKFRVDRDTGDTGDTPADDGETATGDTAQGDEPGPEESTEPAEQGPDPERQVKSEFDFQAQPESDTDPGSEPPSGSESDTDPGSEPPSGSESDAHPGSEPPSGSESDRRRQRRPESSQDTESGPRREETEPQGGDTHSRIENLTEDQARSPAQDQAPTQPQDQAPTQPQDQATTQPPNQATTQPPDRASTQAQVQVTETEAPEEGFDVGEDRELVADHPIKGEVLRDVQVYFQELDDDATFASLPPVEFIRDRWFDFGYLDDHEVVEWQWADKPYAYVAVVQRDGEDKYRYHVSEVDLNEFEQYVRDDLVKILRNSLMYQDLEDSSRREEVFETKVKEIISDQAAATVEDGTLLKLKYYLMRDFVHHGPIDPMMRDPDIEDISCDGVDVPVYVYHFGYRDLQSNIRFGQQELNSFTLRLAQRAGEQVSVSDPLVDGTLPDGSRLQLTFGSDVSTRGSNFTIRKFANIPFTPVDLVQRGTFNVEQMAYFWLAIESNRSLIFSGGTASGKTTSMNAVSMFIPEDSKVVSIEDTREITLPHENWVPSLTRESITAEGRGEVTMYELLQAALRQRPEYIIVGEIRTDPNVAFTFFQAIGTGHTAYTTIHAESIEGVLNRLENEPLSVPTQMILELDVVSIQTQTFVDGERVRRNEEVTELLPGGETKDSVSAIDIFDRDAEADTIERVNNSEVLQDIADDRGWGDRQLAEELQERQEFLNYLVDNDISGYDEVTTAIHAFGNNRERLMEQVRTGELTSTALESNL